MAKEIQGISCTPCISCMSCIAAAINYYQEELYLICYRDILDIPRNKALNTQTCEPYG